MLPIGWDEREFEVPGFAGECTCTKCENEVLIPEAEVPQNINAF